MSAILKEIENQALSLSPQERGELIHRLIVSLEGEPEDTPEAIAKAWDEEITRRVADMDAGRTKWIPADEVMSRLRTKVLDAIKCRKSVLAKKRKPTPTPPSTGISKKALLSRQTISSTRSNGHSDC